MLRDDDVGASPLMVIATFVLAAAGLTALLFFAFVDTAPPALSLQQVDEGGVPAFRVVDEHGGLAWDDLSVRFIDPAGVDQADFFLDVPAGDVEPGDTITLRSGLPGGTYHLRVFEGERELHRLVVAVGA